LQHGGGDDGGGGIGIALDGDGRSRDARGRRRGWHWDITVRDHGGGGLWRGRVVQPLLQLLGLDASAARHLRFAQARECHQLLEQQRKLHLRRHGR
jgi:hypothetical protein